MLANANPQYPYTNYDLDSYFDAQKEYAGRVVNIELRSPQRFIDIAALNDEIKYRRAELKQSNRMVVKSDVHKNQNYSMALPLNDFAVREYNSEAFFNQMIFNQEFFSLVNNYRKAYNEQKHAEIDEKRRKYNLAPMPDIPPINYSIYLRQKAKIRSEEMAQLGTIAYYENGVKYSHTRPDRSPWSSIFSPEEEDMYGESAEMMAGVMYNGNPYTIMSERWLAELVFYHWRGSVRHESTMLSSRFMYGGICVRMGDDQGFYKGSNPLIITAIYASKVPDQDR
ncbi:MAG: hypothetical protein Q4E22_02250 [Coriobacteriia bacterium]|nr:hypothetical protein [Coriobacteriia bacterium]